MNIRWIVGLILIVTLASLASVSAFTTGSGLSESVCSTQTALFVIPITNDGTNTEDYTVSLSGNAAKWAVAAPAGLTLKEGETGTVYIYATPSMNALPGEYSLKVTVTSSSGESKTITNALDVADCHKASLVASVSTQESCAGLPAQFSLTLTNEGSFSENFELHLSGSGASVAALSDNVVKLASGETREILVTVNSDDVESYTIAVTAQSQGTGVVATEKLNYVSLGCYDFDLSPDKNYFSFCENSEARIPLSLDNRGTLESTFTLTVDGPKWAALDNTELRIPAGGTRTTNLILFPGYGVSGDFKVDVRAVSKEGGLSSKREIVANVLECHSTGLEIPESEDTICPFTEQSYEVSLANLGQYVEHYAIAVTGVDWASVDDAFKDIDAGESTKFTLNVNPTNVESGQYIVKVTAESQDSCHTSDSDILTINIASRDNCFGVDIDAQYESIDVVYGEGALVPVVVENKGTQESKYDLEVSGTGASYAQLNPSTIALRGGDSETAYLYISMPEQTPTNIYTLTISARLEDGTLSDSDTVEVRLITQDVDVGLGDLFDRDEEEVEEEETDGVVSKIKSVVGGVIDAGVGGTRSVTGLLVAKTAGFSNWLIILGLIVLIGVVIFVWKMVSDLEPSMKEPKEPKSKKGLWERFVDFLEEEDEDFELDKKDKKNDKKKKKGRR